MIDVLDSVTKQRHDAQVELLKEIHMVLCPLALFTNELLYLHYYITGSDPFALP